MKKVKNILSISTLTLISSLQKVFAEEVSPTEILNQIEGEGGLGLSGELNINPSAGIGALISVFLPYILTLAGLILLVMLIIGGFTMLSGAASQESQEKGKKQITSALVGFIILFLAFWIAQIIQVVFRVDTVGLLPNLLLVS